MSTCKPAVGGLVKSLVSSAVKPLLRTNCTAAATAPAAWAVGGVVGGVVAGGPVGTVVVVASDVVDPAGATVVDDGSARGRDVDVAEAVVRAVEGAAVLAEPLELHAHIVRIATHVDATRTRVRPEGNGFIHVDFTGCHRSTR